MHNSEYPVTSFAILDSHTCLTSDNVIDLIMMKLRPLYENRKNLKLECKGSRFTLQDFVFKSTSVQLTSTNSILGILLEVGVSVFQLLNLNCIHVYKLEL